jgi:hypothetical protein
MGQLIIFIGKLVGHEVLIRMVAAKFMSFPDGSIRTLRGIRKSSSGSESLNHFAAFHGNRFTHDYFNRIPFDGAYHRQTDPCISRGGFDYGFFLRQSTAFFRLFNHFYGNTIFDAPGWIKSLQLCVKRDMRLGVQLIYPNKWSAANGIDNVVVHMLSSSILLSNTILYSIFHNKREKSMPGMSFDIKRIWIL